MKKNIIRKMLGLKRGGRMQISSHGAGIYSIQMIRNGKVRENIDLPKEVIQLARIK